MLLAIPIASACSNNHLPPIRHKFTLDCSGYTQEFNQKYYDTILNNLERDISKPSDDPTTATMLNISRKDSSYWDDDQDQIHYYHYLNENITADNIYQYINSQLKYLHNNPPSGVVINTAGYHWLKNDVTIADPQDINELPKFYESHNPNEFPIYSTNYKTNTVVLLYKKYLDGIIKHLNQNPNSLKWISIREDFLSLSPNWINTIYGYNYQPQI